MPRGHGLDRLPRAIVLVEQPPRLLRAARARGEERLVLAAQHDGAHRRIELRVIDVPPARDAVDVVSRRRTIRRRGPLLELALAPRELLLALHASTLTQNPPSVPSVPSVPSGPSVPSVPLPSALSLSLFPLPSPSSLCPLPLHPSADGHPRLPLTPRAATVPACGRAHRREHAASSCSPPSASRGAIATGRWIPPRARP